MVRAREAAMFCVDQMLATDRLSVVTFDDRIEVLFPNEPVTNKEAMKDLISRVKARSSTARESIKRVEFHRVLLS